MKIVEESFWKHPGSPGVFVFAVGKDDQEMFRNKIYEQALLKIPDFFRRAKEALADPKGFVLAAEPEGSKCGWGIMRIGYVKQPNLAAIGIAALELELFARAHPEWHFRLSYPGLEHIAIDTVEPVISMLPDNVTAVVHEQTPQLAPGKMGIHDVYWQVQNHLMYGRHELAKEFLISIGVTNPLDQIAAVERDGVEEFVWRRERKLRSQTASRGQ